jgi:hypothetical protein
MRLLVASAFIAITLGPAPASAQKTPPINLLGEKTIDAGTAQRRRDIENDYNETMKKIPDKKKSADPWGSVRPSDSKPQGK